MIISTSAMSFIIKPLAKVAIAINVNKSANAVCLVIHPVTLVLGSIFPNLKTSALSKTVSCPLSEIYSSIV